MKKQTLRIIILTLVIVIIGSIGISLTVDTGRNNAVEKVPSRPFEGIKGDPNKILDHFVNGTELPEGDTVDIHIEGTCTYIDGRYDCSDFRLVSIMQIMYKHRDKLTAAQEARIKETLLGFKYWMDENGDDSMCYWSENHQVLFATAEYLAGKLYPGEVFSSDGLSGAEKMVQAKERILIWLEQRWNYGFTEFYSNVYYVEDVGPLANLIDLTGDHEIQTKAQIIMDLLIYDLASHSFKGTFAPASGRAYEKNRKSGQNSSISGVIQHIWGYDLGKEERRGMDQAFYYIENYQVPDVIYQIGLDQGERIIKATNGLNLTDLEDEGLIGLEDEQIMMQWAMESFTNPETISNTVEALNHFGMMSNEFLAAFKMVNYSILRKFGLLPVISRILDPQFNGNAIQRGNVYTFRNDSYAMTTAQAYHPGTHGDQQGVFQVTLNNDVSIFNSHPAVNIDDKGPNGNSPTYWVGAGRLPHSVQDENINMSLYLLPNDKGIMEKKMLHYTHGWMDESYMDEVVVAGRYIFGRLGETFVAMIGKNNLEYIIPIQRKDAKALETDDRKEIIQQGQNTYWITELSTLSNEGSFLNFQDRIKSNPVGLLGDTLRYESNRKEMSVTFARQFTVNGEVVDVEYDRFEAPYIHAERKAETLTFKWGGKELFLDFYNLERRIN